MKAAAVVLVVGVLLVFTWWFTHTCAMTHGGHWWCWVG